MNNPDLKELADRFAREATLRGEIVRAGWIGYNLLVLNKNAPAIQRAECEMAFFSGAQHLFGSIMQVLDADKDPTESDLKMMANIHAELQAFIATFKAKYGL